MKTFKPEVIQLQPRLPFFAEASQFVGLQSLSCEAQPPPLALNANDQDEYAFALQQSDQPSAPPQKHLVE